MDKSQRIHSFKNLIEVQRLELKIKSILVRIDEEKSRMTNFEKIINTKNQLLDEQKEKLSSLSIELTLNENSLEKTDSQIEKSESYISMVSSDTELKALQKEIEKAKANKEELEEKIFEQLESKEELLSLISETEGFLKGAESTRSEIKSDIQMLENDNATELNSLNERIQALHQQTDKNILEAFKSSHKKYQYNDPVAFVISNRCNQCSFQIDNLTQDNLDRLYSVELCPGCHRLLCPQDARNN
ncbi:MAG: zinc ribbon domain-containing protein [Bacteriovoracaceae bacterium]